MPRTVNVVRSLVDVKRSDTIRQSASLTATANGSDVETPPWARGALFLLDVSTALGSTLAVSFQAKDQLSGSYVNIPSASFASTATALPDTLVVHPDVAASANVTVAHPLSQVFRPVYTISGTALGITFSLGVEWLD